VNVNLPDSGIIAFVVDSPQTFLVKPDPRAPEKWVVYRQMDREATGGKMHDRAGGASTESKSWGGIKGLFR
jgi:hypothetical protein